MFARLLVEMIEVTVVCGTIVVVVAVISARRK